MFIPNLATVVTFELTLSSTQHECAVHGLQPVRTTLPGEWRYSQRVLLGSGRTL